MMNLKNIWNPPKYKCRKCEDIIWSKYPGEFVMCKCEAIAVDQTEYYSRYMGNPEDFIEADISGRRDDDIQQGPSV